LAQTPFPGDAVVSGGVISKAKFGDIVILNLADLDTRTTAVESGKVATSRTITAGTGLTGGGDLTANRTLAADFGTAAGKVAQGNDTRITVTQDATIGNSALGTRATNLETGRALNKTSRWYSTETVTHTSATQAVGTWTADGTGAGDITVSGDTFTVVNTGVYDLTANYVGTYALTFTATAGYAQIGFNANMFIGNNPLTKIYAQAEYFYYQYAPGSLELAMNIHSGPIALAAGSTFTLKVGTAQNVTTTGGDGYKRTFLAVQRIS
jgi:hypothetical protein